MKACMTNGHGAYDSTLGWCQRKHYSCSSGRNWSVYNDATELAVHGRSSNVNEEAYLVSSNKIVILMETPVSI
jgi:hypothetical protein